MVKNAIKVYARLKPEKNRKSIMNYQIHHRPKENVDEDLLFLVTPMPKSKDYPDNRAESWNFSFYHIFEESTTQEDVFKSVAQPVVESALDGYNGTIFAYGQRPENVYSIEVAYLEIYNENGYDLLDRNLQGDLPVTRLEDLPRVTVQEDETGQLHLKNLTFHCVGSVEEAFELLVAGDNNRVTTETPMNPESSRSHCIFTIVVCTKEFGADVYKRAKVHLVDLAGSERVYKCSISGTILTEAKHINLSLHYLEQVIVCLGQESTGHIPYRNSFLTSILRDSLGGNCLTTMLATMSVATHNLEETLSTCRFAQRVAMIRNDVKVVLETDIRSENALLRLENEKLRQKLKELTKEPKIEELTAEDKQNLDLQVRNFLESDGSINVDNNLKKVEYCFESFRRIFKLNRDPNSCLNKLEYYKDMVIQRDKEILALLIDLAKKERNKWKEDCCNESSSVRETEEEDDSKLIDRLNIAASEPDEIRMNLEFHEREEHPSEATTKINDNKISPAIDNILKNSILPKKQKWKSKVSKSPLQENFLNHDRNKINFDEDVSTNIDTCKITDQKEPMARFSACKSTFNDTLRRDFFQPCNVINLTLNDSTETVQAAPQSSHKKERKKEKCGQLETRKKKTAKTKQDAETESNVDSTSARTRIERSEVSFVEAQDPTSSVYHRSLTLNLPKYFNNSATENLTGRKVIDLASPVPSLTNIDSDQQWNVPMLNFQEDSSCKPCVNLNLDSSVSRNREESSIRTRDIDGGLCSRINTGSRQIDAKKSHKRSTRSNASSIDDEVDSIRSKRDDNRASNSSFMLEYPEKRNYVLDEQAKIEREEVGRTSNRCENKQFEASLPLTGDPEIDEEIIAFYKAKRSGGAY